MTITQVTVPWVNAGDNPATARLVAAAAMAESGGYLNAIGCNGRADPWQPPSLLPANLLPGPAASAAMIILLSAHGTD